MLIKDLPDDTDLRTVKVRIPESLKEERIACGLDTDEVYIYSGWGKGLWLKKDLNDSRVYPLTGYLGAENWEVIAVQSQIGEIKVESQKN